MKHKLEKKKMGMRMVCQDLNLSLFYLVHGVILYILKKLIISSCMKYFPFYFKEKNERKK